MSAPAGGGRGSPRPGMPQQPPEPGQSKKRQQAVLRSAQTGLPQPGGRGLARQQQQQQEQASQTPSAKRQKGAGGEPVDPLSLPGPVRALLVADGSVNPGCRDEAFGLAASLIGDLSVPFLCVQLLLLGFERDSLTGEQRGMQRDALRMLQDNAPEVVRVFADLSGAVAFTLQQTSQHLSLALQQQQEPAAAAAGQEPAVAAGEQQDNEQAPPLPALQHDAQGGEQGRPAVAQQQAAAADGEQRLGAAATQQGDLGQQSPAAAASEGGGVQEEQEQQQPGASTQGGGTEQEKEEKQPQQEQAEKKSKEEAEHQLSTDAFYKAVLSLLVTITLNLAADAPRAREVFVVANMPWQALEHEDDDLRSSAEALIANSVKFHNIIGRAALINTVHEKLGTLSPNTTQPAGIAALLELVATAAPGTNMMNTLRGDVVRDLASLHTHPTAIKFVDRLNNAVYAMCDGGKHTQFVLQETLTQHLADARGEWSRTVDHGLTTGFFQLVHNLHNDQLSSEASAPVEVLIETYVTVTVKVLAGAANQQEGMRRGPAAMLSGLLLHIDGEALVPVIAAALQQLAGESHQLEVLQGVTQRLQQFLPVRDEATGAVTLAVQDSGFISSCLSLLYSVAEPMLQLQGELSAAQVDTVRDVFDVGCSLAGYLNLLCVQEEQQAAMQEGRQHVVTSEVSAGLQELDHVLTSAAYCSGDHTQVLCASVMQGLNRVLGRPELARMLGFLYLKSDFCEATIHAAAALGGMRADEIAANLHKPLLSCLVGLVSKLEEGVCADAAKMLRQLFGYNEAIRQPILDELRASIRAVLDFNQQYAPLTCEAPAMLATLTALAEDIQLNMPQSIFDLGSFVLYDLMPVYMRDDLALHAFELQLLITRMVTLQVLRRGDVAEQLNAGWERRPTRDRRMADLLGVLVKGAIAAEREGKPPDFHLRYVAKPLPFLLASNDTEVRSTARTIMESTLMRDEYVQKGIAKQLAEGCVDLLEAREEDYAAANKRRALRTICSNMRGKQHEDELKRMIIAETDARAVRPEHRDYVGTRLASIPGWDIPDEDV